MKFDLFDAMRFVEKELGCGGEILVSRGSDQSFVIRISNYRIESPTHSQFEVAVEEFEDSQVPVMNLRFQRALMEAKLAVVPPEATEEDLHNDPL
jgi:hypothetical protein